MKPRKPIKRTRIKTSKRARKRRGQVKQRDMEARQLIVVERDQNTCQRCGIKEGEVRDGYLAVIQWSHIISRRYYVVRWDPENSMAKCSRCHTWWTNNPMQGAEWFIKHWPERWERIHAKLNSGERVRV